MNLIIEEIVQSRPSKPKAFRRVRWSDAAEIDQATATFLEPNDTSELWLETSNRRKVFLVDFRVVARRNGSNNCVVTLIADVISQEVLDEIKTWCVQKYRCDFKSDVLPRKDWYIAWAEEHQVWP